MEGGRKGRGRTGWGEGSVGGYIHLRPRREGRGDVARVKRTYVRRLIRMRDEERTLRVGDCAGVSIVDEAPSRPRSSHRSSLTFAHHAPAASSPHYVEGGVGMGFRAGTAPTRCPQGTDGHSHFSHHLRRGALNGRERKRVAALLCTSGLVRNRNSVHGRVPCSIWPPRPSWLTETPGRVGGNAPPQIRLWLESECRCTLGTWPGICFAMHREHGHWTQAPSTRHCVNLSSGEQSKVRESR